MLFGENCCFLQLMWSVANSLEHWGPKGWWLMRPNIAAAASLPPPFLTKIPITILANIPFLSPRLQLSEIERISELSQFSAESGERTHLLLPFFCRSKVGKLEKGGILRLLSSSPTKARQLSSWRRRRKAKRGEKGTRKKEMRLREILLKKMSNSWSI